MIIKHKQLAIQKHNTNKKQKRTKRRNEKFPLNRKRQKENEVLLSPNNKQNGK